MALFYVKLGHPTADVCNRLGSGIVPQRRCPTLRKDTKEHSQFIQDYFLARVFNFWYRNIVIISLPYKVTEIFTGLLMYTDICRLGCISSQYLSLNTLYQMSALMSIMSNAYNNMSRREAFLQTKALISEIARWF